MSVDRDQAIMEFVQLVALMEKKLQVLSTASRSWSQASRGHQVLRSVARDFQQLQAHSRDLMREIGHMDVARSQLAGGSGASEAVQTPQPVRRAPQPVNRTPSALGTASLMALMASTPAPPPGKPPRPLTPIPADTLAFDESMDDLLGDTGEEEFREIPLTPAPDSESERTPPSQAPLSADSRASKVNSLMASMPEEVRRRLKDQGME